MNKKILVSCVLSTLLWGVNEADKEYQVNFSDGTGSYKKPTFQPSVQENQTFSWDRVDGIFRVKPTKNLMLNAIFTSDQDKYGILTLKDFTYINTVNDFKDPTKEDAEAGKIEKSNLVFQNQNQGNGFKGFILGGSQAGQGSVNLFSGANLEIKGFTQTTLQGTINVNSGGISKENSSYGRLDSSLKVGSQEDYSTLALKSSLNLITNNGMERTQERAAATFEANVKGNIFIDGYVNIGDKAKMTATAGNVLKISSTIYVSAQEMKKITQDTLGNQSIKEEDRVKETNLTLKAKKIELSGSLDVGLYAREMETREDPIGGTDEGMKKTIITQLPSDIGSIVEITLDINDNQAPKPYGEKPKDWEEATKAQFIQTSGGRISVGKNSEVRLATINKSTGDSGKIFDEKDPYAIRLSNITIQDQDEKNKLFNFDAKAQIGNNSQTSGTKENAGKVLFQGRVELGKNARVRISAYDGIDLNKDSRFVLAKDSLMWLSMGEKTDFSISNEGNIEVKGGAFLFGEKFSGNGQKTISLKNTGSILISDSLRPIEEGTSYFISPKTNQTQYADPLGIFLLGQKNTIDNQGVMTFDGAGNLTTFKQDEVVRDLEISNSLSGKKGAIEVKGSSNSIVSGGSITLLSQDISIAQKKIEEEGKKAKIQEGELIIRSESGSRQSRIIFGREQEDSGKDRVSITGGTLRIESKLAEVDSYNLRLVDTTMDLSKLSSRDKTSGAIVEGAGIFTNYRRLEFGGGVKVFLANKGNFVNGKPQGKVSQFKKDLPTMQISGDNSLLLQGRNPAEELPKERLRFDNYANVALKSKSSLTIEGDLYHSGSLVYQGDHFGVGSVFVLGDTTIDMSNHQGGNQSVNPLFVVNHTNFYSLTLNRSYLLLHSQEGIKYGVDSVVIDSKNTHESQSENLTYEKQQEYLKLEIENYLNGEGVYSGNENKLGIFLKGNALVDAYNVGFMLTRSSAIADIKPNTSQIGVLTQYADVLAKSEGQISQNKTQAMISTISSSHPRAMEALNNALESQNSLELEILKDIGSYNTAGLVKMAKAINTSMQGVADIEKPLLEDFQKMQVVREIAVQNRMMRFSNPYVAEIELARYIQAIAKNRYAQASEIQSDVVSANPISPSYNPQETENLSYKNSFWASVISSTTKEFKNTSALYGFNVGYEHMPIYNVLLGLYVAYGYSNFKGEVLKNNAHNVDLTAYTRLYYGSSEIDISLSYIHALNDIRIENNEERLNQKFDFASNAFDINLKYGYIFGFKKIKGLFIKPQGGLAFYGLTIPRLSSESNAPIIYEQQMKNGIIFNLGAEIRQYVSAYSYLYLLPSFEYDLSNLGEQGKNQAVVYFSGASNKMSYTSQTQPKGLFSIYAGGEGYIGPDFSMNLSAGYKAGLDKEEHNISISAGFKYKF